MAAQQGNEFAERSLDGEITTVRSDRRSFLSRAIGVGTVGVGALIAGACEVPTVVDTDITRVDGDRTRSGDPATTDRDAGIFGDPVGRGRFTDSDVTTVADPPRIGD